MSELPEGWCLANLNELSSLINGDRGKNYPSKSELFDSGVPFINAGHILDGKIDFLRMNYIAEEHFNLLGGGKIQCNDILYCLRGSLGKTALITDSGKGAIASSLVIIRPLKNSDPKYLYYFLVSPFGKEEISKHDNGSAQPNLSAANVGSYSIPLPPLNEQRRIVAKLDRLFAHSRRAREELQRVSGLCDRYKQAILASAILGEMTQEWRERHKLPELEKVQLAEVASEFSYGSSAKSHSSGTVPVLRMGNIQDGLLDWSNLAYTSDSSEIEKYRLQEGDVLFNRTNSPELVGKTALYQDKREAIYAGYLIRIRCDSKLLPAFLTYALNSPIGRYYCWQVKTDGVSQSNINAKKLGAFTFNLPSIEEQKEIVQRVEKLFKAIDLLEQEYQKASKLCDRLEQATLTKAFRGELVPQDPNDEPAAALLERIQAERQQPKGKAVKSKKSPS